MTDVGGVSRPSPNRIDAPSSQPPGRVPSAPPVDVGRVDRTEPPPQSLATLPPGPQAIDYGQARSATQAMSDNVGFDFGRVAALMMQIDSELARAARDSQVAQIESVASQMHASADDIRESAKLALAGGVVSGATQIASAGISVGGGIKGMSLTSSSAASQAGAAAPEPAMGAANEPAPTTGPEQPSGATPTAPTMEEAALPESSQTQAGQGGTQALRQETTQETVAESSSGRQKMATRNLDHTLSQQLSARSQNVALMSEGLSKLSSATGEMIKSALDYESRQKDADSKEAEALAEEQRAYLDRTKGFADAMQKGAQDMLQAYQQMEESVHQTNRAIWSRA